MCDTGFCDDPYDDTRDEYADDHDFINDDLHYAAKEGNR